MKHRFFLILSVFMTAFLPSMKAETPASLCGDDSVTTPDFSGITTAQYQQLQPAIPVNENEIKAGLLYDAVNKKVIWQKNISTPFPIASLTKMMVALLAVEDVRAEKFTWNDNVKWTRATVVGRRKNRKTVYSDVNYSLKDVFKASMIASNNECAEQMAKFLSAGNLQATIDRMNARAKELGMISTYYGNPTGLPAPHSMFDNTSTPSDLLLLTMEMLKYSEVTEIASMGYAAIENGKRSSVISNHNRLTIEYSGEVDGLKTGYTRRAGFCLVATTAKCDHRLISIVLGCRGPQIRNEVVRDMINDYYSYIGLDRLGPQCAAPYASAVTTPQNSANGKYVTVNESVKKIHVVKKNENLSTIAAKYRCSVTQLKSWNKKGVRSNVIVTGQKLAVYTKQKKNIFIQNPVNGDEADDDKPLITDSEKKDIDSAAEQVDKPEATIEKETVKTPEKYLYHVVAPGDTLFSIAQSYKGITVEELKSLNKITDTRNLKPGTKLKVKVQS